MRETGRIRRRAYHCSRRQHDACGIPLCHGTTSICLVVIPATLLTQSHAESRVTPRMGSGVLGGVQGDCRPGLSFAANSARDLRALLRLLPSDPEGKRGGAPTPTKRQPNRLPTMAGQPAQSMRTLNDQVDPVVAKLVSPQGPDGRRHGWVVE